MATVEHEGNNNGRLSRNYSDLFEIREAPLQSFRQLQRASLNLTLYYLGRSCRLI